MTFQAKHVCHMPKQQQKNLRPFICKKKLYPFLLSQGKERGKLCEHSWEEKQQPAKRRDHNSFHNKKEY